MRRKASIISSLLCFVLVLGLGVLLFLQNQNFEKYKIESKKKIALLTKEKIKPKKIQKIVEVNATRKQVIPKDAIVVTIPKVPQVTAKVPQVITIGGSKVEKEKDTQLSMDMPVEKEEVVKKDTNSSQNKEDIKLVGLNESGRVSAYLRTSYIDNEKVKQSLKDNDFEIIGEEKLSHGLVSIVFTNKELKKLGEKSPYISTLRVLLNKSKNQTTVQNPLYFAKAFLQNNFDEERVLKILKSVNKSFDNLKASSDKLKYTLLPKYQFMFGMPYYKDMIKIASSSNTKSLLSKLDKNSIIFTQKISDNKYLVGVKLSIKSEKFIDMIGDQNALLLPYPIMIENGVAKILNPKYYIAISYPMLKMSQFMKISSIPDEIENDCKRLFR